MGKADPIKRRGGVRARPPAPAHLAGIGAILLAVLLAFIDLRAALVPVTTFVLACLAAPFFPRWNFFLPAVTRGCRGGRAVSLTFDDGPHPQTTPRLLELLEGRSVPAAFFVTGENAARHPELIREILARGHEIGNHSQTHDALLMLRSGARLRREIARCQETLAGLGVRPAAFRPPVGIVSPRLRRPLIEMGMYCVAFSVRGRDRGNRRVAVLAARILKKATGGDILLLHDVPPRGASVEDWLREVELVIAGLKERGLSPVPLSELIGRPVMEPIGGPRFVNT